MNLADIQRGMCAHLVMSDPAIAAHVRGDAATRLHVYHHAYRAQLRAVLRDTYAKTWAWLGDARFDAVALDYIAHHPPQSRTLNDYGDRFADALHAAYADDPEIADLARLEHALRRAFDGTDATPVDPLSIVDVDWDTAVLRFEPTLRLVPVTTNVAAIWNALEAGRTPPAAIAFGPATLRIWRQDLSPRFRTIEAHEHLALTLALSGASFGAVCEAVAATLAGDDAAPIVGGLLTTWLHDGLVVAIT